MFFCLAPPIIFHYHTTTPALLYTSQDPSHGGRQELEAWQQRAQVLATLHSQLQAPTAARVLAVLEAAKSAQHLALTRYVHWENW